jgi:hypothetical protein
MGTPPLVRRAVAGRAATPGCPGWFLGPVLPPDIARTQNGAPPQWAKILSGQEFQYTDEVITTKCGSIDAKYH